jgi:hypothetical protein
MIPVAQRESGLIVPLHLAGVPEVKEGAESRVADDVPRDADGRRRIVLTREARRTFTKMVRELGPQHLAILLSCRTQRHVVREVEDATTHEKVPVLVTEPIPDACGEILIREDEDGADPGFGCKCSRIHFVSAGAAESPFRQ